MSNTAVETTQTEQPKRTVETQAKLIPGHPGWIAFHARSKLFFGDGRENTGLEFLAALNVNGGMHLHQLSEKTSGKTTMLDMAAEEIIFCMARTYNPNLKWGLTFGPSVRTMINRLREHPEDAGRTDQLDEWLTTLDL